MDIPSSFYTGFRVKTSFLAAGTGAIIGLLASFFGGGIISYIFQLPDILVIIAFIFGGSFIGVLLNQVIIRKYFFGKMRGAFEFAYKEYAYDNQIKSALSGTNQNGELELNSVCVYKQLMSRTDTLKGDDLFWCYMAAAKAASVGGEDDNAIAALKRALSIRPVDLVANYRLAREFERKGSAREAIAAYENSLHDPTIDSEVLKNYIQSQIQTVKQYGPRKRLVPIHLLR